MLKKDDSHYNTLGPSNQHLTNNNFMSQPLLNNSQHSIRSKQLYNFKFSSFGSKGHLVAKVEIMILQIQTFYL